MEQWKFPYIIVGAGLAGASAIEGIRSVDGKGEILLIGKEKHLPYHRPPLSKSLWTRKKRVDEIFVHTKDYYEDQGVEVRLGVEVEDIETQKKSVTDSVGNRFGFEKLLIATGGNPVHLHIPGATDKEVRYLRNLDDYLELERLSKQGGEAVIIGAGFIGTELAAALTMNNVKVTMIFPDKWPCFKVFPDYLGTQILHLFQQRGITMVSEDRPLEFIQNNAGRFLKTEKGTLLSANMVIAGIGIAPSMELAQKAGLATGNGILANAYLQTSHPDIYVAGDGASVWDQWIGENKRVEHWDNALNQGKQAGKNMAGAQERYMHMSYFFSDLFEFGYEAVGRIDSKLPTVADWQEENSRGVVYYLDDNKVRGVLLCNIWEKTEAATDLIKQDKVVTVESLRGAIR